MISGDSGHLLIGGTFQKLVDQSLIRFGLLGSQAAELSEKPRSDADGDQLLRIAGDGPSHAPGAAELLAGGFRDIGQVEPTIRHMPGVPCGSPGAR